MRIRTRAYAVIAAALQVNIALAHPDGAPWGAARPSAAESCATCHFDSDANRDSEQLRIEGLPENPGAGETYELTVSLNDPYAVVVGFQMFAFAGDEQAGTFESAAANVESVGAAIRSTIPVKSDEVVSWQIEWRAPAEFRNPIVIYVAASAANDDGSPLGDQIHFRSYRLLPAEISRLRK